MKSPVKNVLMICWHFPPANHSASKRSGCFAKYLPLYGWKPFVFCPQWTSSNCEFDSEYVKNIPSEVEIKTVPYKEFYPTSLPSYMLEKVHRFLFPHLIPRDWLSEAKACLADLINRNSFDAIWATYPGMGALPHVLASWASNRWRIPWLADFRDIPGQSVYDKLLYKMRLPFELLWERKILSNAAAVVTVSDALASRLSQRNCRRVEVIANGFDPDDYRDLTQREPASPARFTLVYAGMITFPERNPRPILDALGLLISRGHIQEDKVSFDFYRTDPDVIKKIFSGHPYQSLVRCHGTLSTREITKVFASATVLVQLANGKSPGLMSGKIFEYVAVNRPILSVPNDNDCVDDLLARTGAGVALTRIDDIASQIGKWYRQWEETGRLHLHSNRSVVELYSRKEQTRKLANMLDAMTR